MPIAALRDANARLYYRLEGHPGHPPLMLVHPVGADLSIWDHVVPALTRQFHVLRYDQRGHGGSDTLPGDYTVDQLASDLLAMADVAGWQRFAVCGISIGAMTAARVAATAPERITHLAVCSAAPVMGQPPGGWDGRARDARAQGMAASADGMVARMFSAAHRASGDPLIDTLRTVCQRMDANGYAASLAVLRDTDLRPVLGQVQAPTLVMTGQDDPLVHADAAQAFLAGVRQARHVVMDGGHFPPVEQPTAFVAELTRFLSA